MEARDHAYKLFTKMINNETNLDDETLKNLARSIQKLLRDSLSKLDPSYRFHFNEYWLVIKKTAEESKLIPEKAAEAFENLETYFILLYRAPWKKEFRRLKTYGGFFQSKIKAHLKDPESIICLVGFTPEGSGTLSLKGHVDPSLLLSVAFECVVASVECEMISEFHRKMKESGALVIDVVRWRETGEMPEIKRTIPNSKELSKASGTDSAYVSDGHRSLTTRPAVAGAEGVACGKNLPFIDDDEQGVTNDTGYVEGTIDEHYMASLKQLSQTSGRQVSPNVPTEDWSYVTNTLKNKYGQAYFEGARGDVIRNQREDIRVRYNDDFSDEGIDVDERPPPVNIHNPQVRIEHRITASSGSHDRTRDSGYRTAPSSQVHYPPNQQFSLSSPGVQSSSGTSAYVSHSSGRSPVPIVARGVSADNGYPNRERLTKKSSNYDSYNRGAQHSSRTTTDMMSSKMQQMGLNADWSCFFCTYRNSRDTGICSGCGKSRGQGTDVDGPNCGDSITVCKKCTLENEPGQLVCAACDNELDKANVHTFV